MKVAVVGATGMVGEIMLKVLKERNFQSKKINIWMDRIKIKSKKTALSTYFKVHAFFTISSKSKIAWSKKVQMHKPWQFFTSSELHLYYIFSGRRNIKKNTKVMHLKV